MTDTFDPEKRSWIMRQVLSRGTKPERAVSEALRASGLHFQSNVKGIAGNPDIIFRKLKLAIFINGCFWHWHGCGRCRMPATNGQYWSAKIASNVERDKKHRRELHGAGWRYLTIWECKLAEGISRTIRTVQSIRQRAVEIGSENERRSRLRGSRSH